MPVPPEENIHYTPRTPMFEYRDKNKWRNSISLHLIIAVLLWLPLGIGLFVVAVRTGHLPVYLFSFSISLMSGLWLFHRAQTNIIFPSVEVSERHLILNPPMTRRTVYNLKHIEGARFFKHILYFRHNGWPVLAPLPRMPKAVREQLLTAIKRSQHSLPSAPG